MNDIVKRAPQFLLSIAVCFASLWIFNFSHFLLFKLLAAILIFIACNELCTMFLLKRNATYTVILVSMVVPCLFLVSQYITILQSFFVQFSEYTNILLLFTIGITLLIILHKNDSKKRIHGALFKSIFVFSLSIVYLAMPLYLLFSISQFDNALMLYFFPVITVAILDTSSYLCGTLFGNKSKRIFYLSPNKTYIGLICGVTITLVSVYIVIIQLYKPSSLLDFQIVLLIMIVIGGGIIGDLFGSLLKRMAQVKDSGTLVKGRGGVIDSIDSLLFVVILFWSFGPVLMPALWR